MAQPAAAVPPDVMAPTLGAPAPQGSAGLGQAPPASLPPAGGSGGAGPSATPVAAKSSSAAPPPAVLSLTARYATRTAWADGYVADIFVTNPASVAQSFAVQLDLPRYVSLTNQVWNATADGFFGTVTFRGGPVAAGQTLQFGFSANKSSYIQDVRQLTPTGCRVNGNVCDGFSNPAPSNDPPGDGPWWSSVQADGVPQSGMWRFG